MMRQPFSVWKSGKPFAREEDRSLQEYLMENPLQDGIDHFIDVTEPEVHFFRPSWFVRAEDITIWSGVRKGWISPPS